MLLTVSLLVLGTLAVLSMVMMIGNVFNKSPYGKVWAFIGGMSVLFAGVLMFLQMFMPSLETIEAADQPQQQTNDPHKTKIKTQAPAQVQKQQSPHTDSGQPVVTEEDAAANASDVESLAFLSTVMESLQSGNPIPPELLALLPGGGQGIAVSQAKNEPSGTTLSKPLQSQLVSISASQGKTQYAGTSYVPTKPSSGTASGAGKVPTGSGFKDSTPTKNVPSTPPSSTGTTPYQPPAKTPTPIPKPPVPSPPSKSSPALLDGGMLKSLLGRSKTDVDAFMAYSQSLGSSGDTYRYLKGVAIVEITYSGSVAKQVKMTFNQFTPPGQTQSYYEDYLRSMSGMSDENPSSTSGKDVVWNGVFPGASSIKFHIDAAGNFGSVTAIL